MSSTLLIAIIGRPNVGKSTFFNLLIQKNRAITSNIPKSTLDRQYGCIKNKNQKLIFIDTAGILEINKDNNLDIKSKEQSIFAIQEAHLIFFIVDAKSGIMHDDRFIAQYLRSTQKKIFLLINKIDNFNQDIILSFYSLGLGKGYAISCAHNLGILNFLKKIFYPWIYKNKKILFSEKNNISYKNEKDKKEIKLAIVGYPNVGKSTLINTIISKNRVIVSNIPGTTRENIYISLKKQNRKYLLIDTAGIKKRNLISSKLEKFSINKTLFAIKNADVIILLIDAEKEFSNQEVSLSHFILNQGKALVIGCNKCDKFSKKIKKSIFLRFNFTKFVRIHFISAFYNIGIDNLLKSVIKSYSCSIKNIKTATINKILNTAIKSYPPSLVKNRKIKIKYAHIGGHNPFTIIIHGNQVSQLSTEYKKYLTNYFQSILKLEGILIKILFKENFNPYIKNI